MSALQIYKKKQAELNAKIASHTLLPQDSLAMQELNYRIGVLETFQAFVKGAPMALDPKPLTYHYQLVDASVGFILTEHKFGPKADENGKKRRETALNSLGKAVSDGRKRFSSFKPSRPEQYSETVSKYINTIMPLWVQYRDTYINLTPKKEEKS
ncbi:hypothetical protein [Acutalibacter sp. 1XD8-36]|uniref:hypothetical protein n=1 Tax=Acutalibacter sp. 1XD8-36 TaxID=2320852 RepID=UPI001411D261|nr:hypothetical protein [Acutalibacter sp. 1XD8-36]NBJ90182.1 hypothetical protein [Acutalibacter sp. 1XD8-36]